MFTGNGGSEPGVVLQAVGAGEHIYGERLLNGFAGLSRLELCEFGVTRAQQIGHPSQNPAALGTRECRPIRLRLARAGHGGLDFGRPGRG